MNNIPTARPRVIHAPVKASDEPEAAVTPEPSPPDEPDDAAVAAAVVDVAFPDEVDPGDVVVDPGNVVLEPGDVVVELGDVVVELGDVVVELGDVVVVVVVPVPGTADHTNPWGSPSLAVKVTWVFK